VPPIARSAAAPAAGIGLFLLAVFLLAMMDVGIKWLSADYPTMQIVFFRSLFGLVPLLLPILLTGRWGDLRTRRPLAHLARGLVAVTAAGSFFFALGELPLATVYTIGYSAPLFMTALSVPLLAESVGLRRWAAVLVGFGGVLLAVRPGFGSDFLSLGAAAALVGAFGYALALVSVRLLSRTETNAAIAVYGTLVMAAVSGLWTAGRFVMPGPADFALLVGLGLLGGGAALAMVEAFRRSPAAVLAPFEYSTIVWGVAFGYLIWDEVPDAWVATGATVVIASGLYVAQRERGRRPVAAARTGAAGGAGR
jgi:drug/metabolite transporter (DMT)-like permease